MKRDYSDWEIVEEQSAPDYSDWEAVGSAGDNMPEQPQASQGPDWSGVLGDVAQGGVNAVGNIVGSFGRIPELLEQFRGLEGMGAKRLGQNALTGLAQGGHQLLNIPSNIGRYAEERRFLPEGWGQAIPRHEDFDYGNFLGLTDERPGDALIQALSRLSTSGIAGGPIRAAAVDAIGGGNNPIEAALNLLIPKGVGKTVQGYNNLSRGNVAKGLVSAEKAAKSAAKQGYTAIFNEADKIGANTGLTAPKVDVKSIAKGATNKKFLKAIDVAESHPTIENFNKVQSDLGKFIRSKEKLNGLSSVEIEAVNKARAAQARYKKEIAAAFEKSGKPELYDKYKAANKDYLENVVPYSENKLLQKFKKGKKTPEGLVTSLAKSDDFKAALGKKHPEVTLSHASRGFGALDKAGEIGGALRDKLIKALKGEK